MANNRERQEDEITALASICDEKEFFCVKNIQIKCTFNVYLNTPKKLDVQYTDNNSSNASVFCNKILIEHLPPIKLYVKLPDTYPSHEPPYFSLSINWLPPWEISFVCHKLDEIWKANKGNEILYLWQDFLQNDFLNFLGIKDSLDVSLMYVAYLKPDYYSKSCLASLSDPRAINEALHLNPVNLLVSYNQEVHQIQFEKNFYTCPVCFEKYIGLLCTELKSCGHIYCRSCIHEYIRTKIFENVNILSCPTLDCSGKIDINEVKILCPSSFSQYEEVMLRVALDTMTDVIYCPRISCQYPVIRDTDEIAVICPNCDYCFCAYCHKVYHGVAPCDMLPEDIKKLVNDYKNSSNKNKKLLEKKYGKQQIQLIQKQLTMQYLNKNTKNCPNCHSFISKMDGCNKMMCSHCQSCFCWLCGQKITSINAYEHFIKGKSPCYGRLFEGSEDIDHDNIAENIIWFEPNI